MNYRWISASLLRFLTWKFSLSKFRAEWFLWNLEKIQSAYFDFTPAIFFKFWAEINLMIYKNFSECIVLTDLQNFKQKFELKLIYRRTKKFQRADFAFGLEMKLIYGTIENFQRVHCVFGLARFFIKIQSWNCSFEA